MKKYSAKSRNLFRHENGFTLMEMVVAMIVLSLITVVMTPFVHTQIRSYFEARDSKYALQLLRIGMNRVLSEIADARGNGSSTDIATFISTEFQFRNNDGTEVEIRYGTFTYDGNSTTGVLFRHTTSSNALPLIPDLTACTFTYLDQNSAVTSVRANIRIVRINITCSYNGKTYQVANQVAPQKFQL